VTGTCQTLEQIPLNLVVKFAGAMKGGGLLRLVVCPQRVPEPSYRLRPRKGKLKALQGPHHAHYVIEKPVSIRELRATIDIAVTECGLAETIHALQSLERAERIQALGMERRFTKRLARQHDLLQRLRKTTERPNISELAREYVA